MLLKSDAITEAFSLLRISGLTLSPETEENALALRRLECAAAEMYERNICLGYNFTETPASTDSLGVPLAYLYSLACVVAFKMFPDFGKGKEPDMTLVSLARAGESYLTAATANVREVQPPERQPMGSGTELRYSRYNTFSKPVPIAPNECATNTMYIDDINDFTESFSGYLKASETIISYTLEVSEGLTVTAQAIAASNEEIEYTVRADGNSELSSDTFLQVKIVVTTSTGRIETRFINFILKESDIS